MLAKIVLLLQLLVSHLLQKVAACCMFTHPLTQSSSALRCSYEQGESDYSCRHHLRMKLYTCNSAKWEGCTILRHMFWYTWLEGLSNYWGKPVHFPIAAYENAFRGWGKALYSCSRGQWGHKALRERDTNKWKVRSVSRNASSFPPLVVLSLDFTCLLNVFLSVATSFNCLSSLADLRIQNVDLEKFENQREHRTEDFTSSKALVVRRGAPFRLSLQLGGRPFNPNTDSLTIKIMLGSLDLHSDFSYSYFGWIADFCMQPVWTVFLSPPLRPPVCDDARHFLHKGFYLTLESVHGPTGPEPPETLHIHLLSRHLLCGRLQIWALSVHSEWPKEVHLWQIHPALQSLVSWWVQDKTQWTNKKQQQQQRANHTRNVLEFMIMCCIHSSPLITY